VSRKKEEKKKIVAARSSFFRGKKGGRKNDHRPRKKTLHSDPESRSEEGGRAPPADPTLFFPIRVPSKREEGGKGARPRDLAKGKGEETRRNTGGICQVIPVCSSRSPQREEGSWRTAKVRTSPREKKGEGGKVPSSPINRSSVRTKREGKILERVHGTSNGG